MREWSRRYLCHWCHKLSTVRRATIRVFAGIWGGGWPACTEHEKKAVEVALRSMFDGPVASNFDVTAYRVEVHEDGGPKMTTRLFTACRKDPNKSCPP